MSSPEFIRQTARWAAAAALALGLTACLRPRHGPTASGEPLAEMLAAVQVEPVTVAAGQERLSHYLRSELVYGFNGSGQPKPKRYKLSITAIAGLAATLTDSITGRADSATINGTATYALVDLASGKIVTSGTAVGTATYDRSPQRFGSVRAGRDAEVRLGKLLAEQIKIRLASVLATGVAPSRPDVSVPNVLNRGFEPFPVGANRL